MAQGAAMTRTSSQNKALAATEDKSLAPAEPTEDKALVVTDPAEKPAADPAAKEAPSTEPEKVKVVWAQFSRGRKPGEKVDLSPEEARAMIAAGHAAPPA